MFEPYHPARLRRDQPEAARLGLLFVLLAGVGLWTTALAVGVREAALFERLPAPLLTGSFVAAGLGYGLPAVAYVAVAGVDVPYGLPSRGRPGSVALAVAAPVALVALVSGAANAAGVTLSELVQIRYAPSVGPAFLLRSTVGPALLEALGFGLLLFGAVQATLREAVEPDHAIVLTVLVALVFETLPFTTPGLPSAGAVVLFVLAAVLAVAMGLSTGVLYRAVVRDGAREAVASLREGPYLPLVGLGAVGFVLLVAGVAEYPEVVTTPMWMLVVGSGAVACERSRSLWPAVATVFLYRVAVGLAVYAESVAGLAPGV